MKGLQDYGGLLLASRLKRISESLYGGVDELYSARGVDISSRSVPLLILLRDNGPLGIVELAKLLGQSHPAVTQLSRTLLADRLVSESEDPSDSRRRLLKLTSRSQALLSKLERVWRAISLAVDELGRESGVDLLQAVAGLEAGLTRAPFPARVQSRLRLMEGEEVEILPFDATHRSDFKRLNVEWLEKHFYVEGIDEQVLSHPEETILRPGGFILMAIHQGEAVGTCALIREGDRFELSKMAVTERFQGLGIGRKLLEAAIAKFRQTGARELFLESNSKLSRAVTLYEAHGFVHAPRTSGEKHYQRADVYMVHRGP